MKPYDNPWTVFYRPNAAAYMRLFCFHFAGGSASAYREWPNKLPADVEVVGVQLPGREGRFSEPYIKNFRPIVNTLVDVLQPYLNKPYAVFGHSMGSLLAYEWLRELKQQKVAGPDLFIAAGRQAPHFPDRESAISNLPESEFVAALLKDYKVKLGHVLDNPELREVFIPQLRADFALCEDYEFIDGAKLDCPIVAYAGDGEDKISEEMLLGWQQHTDKALRAKRFPGDHFFVDGAEDLVLQAIRQELAQLLI